MKGKDDMKVIQIGIYPPPVGGISVHIKRLKIYLEKNGIQCTVYNEGNLISNETNVIQIVSYKKFILKLLFLKADIFHFHTTNKFMRMLLGFFKFFRKNIILTVHGESLNNQLLNSGFLSRYLMIRSLKMIDTIICVNNKNTKQLHKLGFEKDKVITIPAFIYPKEVTKDFDKIPVKVWDFIHAQEFLVCANGNVRLYNEEDLYGIDMLIELIYQLDTNGYNVSLLFTVLGVENQNVQEREYYKQLKEKILYYKLENKIFLYEAIDTELYPILKCSQLFIRPTSVDGFGVSIAEAIFYNVPSIASNVCKRPQGTVIFESRNSNDLYTKVTKVIEEYDSYIEAAKKLPKEDHIDRLMSVYKEIMDKP